jgi:hypothetical protein
MYNIDIYTSISSNKNNLTKNSFITSYIPIEEKKYKDYTEIYKAMEDGKAIISAVPFEENVSITTEYIYEILYTSIIQIVLNTSIEKIIKKKQKLDKKEIKEYQIIVKLPNELYFYRNILKEQIEKEIKKTIIIEDVIESQNYYNSFIISKHLEIINIRAENDK